LRRTLKELDPIDAYKNLGTEESHDIEHKTEKGNLRKEYFRGLKFVLETELSAKNKIQVIGSWAVPVLRYKIGIINCLQEELQI